MTRRQEAVTQTLGKTTGGQLASTMEGGKAAGNIGSMTTTRGRQALTTEALQVPAGWTMTHSKVGAARPRRAAGKKRIGSTTTKDRQALTTEALPVPAGWTTSTWPTTRSQACGRSQAAGKKKIGSMTRDRHGLTTEALPVTAGWTTSKAGAALPRQAAGKKGIGSMTTTGSQALTTGGMSGRCGLFPEFVMSKECLAVSHCVTMYI